MKIAAMLALIIVILVAGCDSQTPPDPPPDEVIDRNDKIPAGQLKITPETDMLPPILHSPEYSQPVPLPFPINTAGAEDSSFVMPDGNILYIWFTPDPNAPLSQQLDDGVTGIWVSKKVSGDWQEPIRVLLQDTNEQALDGCAFIQDDQMWFCSARTGYSGLRWFTADEMAGQWTNWQNSDFNPDYEVGELHITSDGRELYFHSSREGGMGLYDIWVSLSQNGEWQPPQNLEVVNSPEVDGWPFITEDGNELWFTRVYMGSPAVYRSLRLNGEWQEPELVISQFAGEPSVDNQGNIYFTHHFYQDGVALEADIYVAYKLPSG